MSVTDNMLDVVAIVIIQERKVLFTKPFNKKVYYLPGGKKKKKETDMDALIREVKEELGVAVIVDSLTLFSQYYTDAYGEGEGVKLHIRYYLGAFEGTITPLSEIETISYMNASEYLSKKEVAPATQLLVADLKKANLID